MKKNNLQFYLTLIVSLLFMFGFKYLPAPMGLSTSGMQVIGIFIGTLILWLTVSIDWPSILLLGALALIPELKFKSILSGAYGDTTFVFLMFTFIITYALSKTSYIKRIALSFITSNLAKKGPWFFVILYGLSIIFLGMFISPTVLFFVYLPIHEEICTLLKLSKGNKLAAMLMMSTVIFCGISSGMTPIAHVFPLIGMGLYADMYGVAIDYARFMMVGIPVGLLTFVMVLLAFKFILKPDMTPLLSFDVNKMKGQEEKITLSEKIILAVFIFVVILWVVPGLLKLLITSGSLYNFLVWFDSLGTAMPPLIGIIILCIVRINGKPLLNIGEAMSKGVSWPSLIMCAGTLALGSALTNADIGFTAWLSAVLSPKIAVLSPTLLVFIFALWAAIETNLSSNMVTATLVSSAALSITTSMTSINIPGIIIAIGIMASYAFATPPAMPCVAVAGSSGWTNTMQMMFYGFIAMFVGILMVTFVGYPIAMLLF